MSNVDALFLIASFYTTMACASGANIRKELINMDKLMEIYLTRLKETLRLKAYSAVEDYLNIMMKRLTEIRDDI